ncbi:MAG TPA: hypothetical protein VF103_00355 [Polyangiaceae bacterium]
MRVHRSVAWGLLVASAVASAARPVAAADTEAKKLNELPGIGSLVPLGFTTFGDFFYQISNLDSDAFHVGTLELDLNLTLNEYVDVTANLAFTGDTGTFGLGAFTIDCGIAGQGSHYLFQQAFLQRSGIVFGKFDVPFGIAYLEYASPDNRLVTLPNVVRETHGGWNDVGVQLYAQASHVNAIAYLVNGTGLRAAGAFGSADPNASAEQSAASDDVGGGRFGLTPLHALEVGISGAFVERGGDFVSGLYGADLRATPGDFDFRLEAIGRLADGVASATRGAYGRVLYRLNRFFATARYGAVFEDSRLVDREIDGGLGVTVFPKAELRIVQAYDIDTGAAVTFFQIVGGTAFQPTGLRR